VRLRTFGGLWIEDPDRLASGAPRPRPLALLAILAAAGPKGLTRDRVLGILWPESGADRARHALSQALYSLRRDLGADAVRSTPDLRLVSLVPSDVQEFRDVVGARRWHDAAALYTGPFLDGFYLAEAPEFERWVEEERAALAADGVRALEHAARERTEHGRPEEARALWQRLARLDPFNARYAVALMESLVAAGDREAALAHGRCHADLVRRELDTEPDRAVRSLLARLREPEPAPPPPVPTPPLPTPLLSTPPLPPPPLPAPALPAPAPRPRWMLRAAGMVAAALLAVTLGWRAVTASGARGLGLDRSGRTADSLVARRYYDEGVRALYQFDAATAGRQFRAALRDDPRSAAVVYRTWETALLLGDSDQNELAERALALAARASPRDSLLVATHVALARNDVAALASARTLAARYPRDAEALTRAAEAIPDLAEAAALLGRAIALDSASAAAAAPCRRCEALHLLASRYWEADSLDAAERTVARWSAMRPADARPWWLRSELRLARGQRQASDDAWRRYQTLGGPVDDADLARLVRSLLADDVDAARAQCDAALAVRDTAVFQRYRWYCAIALRMQGRYRDALALVREGRAPGSALARRDLAVDPHLAALLDLEMGRPLLAADEFRALARAAADSPAAPGIRARGLAWHLTLAATAAVEGGDTLRARALVDTIESVGQRSLYPRDPRLHHFVRGVLYARAGQHEAAVRELRAAVYSPTRGYTRVGYELARSLLALGRPDEAVPVVRAALHGGIEGPELYVSRTALHELLAQSFIEAGQPDSAAAHYDVVTRAWRGADPELRPRYEAARRRSGADAGAPGVTVATRP
jgi:DNA-binding SARP family transcriptional activator